MITTQVRDKGERLLAEDRVSRVLLHCYSVQGETAEYTVWVSFPDDDPPTGRCDCKAGKENIFCSHLYAAAKYELEHPVVAPRHLKAVDSNLSPAGRDLTDPFDIFD